MRCRPRGIKTCAVGIIVDHMISRMPTMSDATELCVSVPRAHNRLTGRAVLPHATGRALCPGRSARQSLYG